MVSAGSVEVKGNGLSPPITASLGHLELNDLE